MAGVAPPLEATGEVPVTEVTVPEPLLLNVVQSAEDSAPRLEAEAVGTFNVMVGVVVGLATVDVKSVPVLPSVNAATLVTVPPTSVDVSVPPDNNNPVPTVISSIVPVPAVVRPTNVPVAIVKLCSAFQSEGWTKFASPSSGMADVLVCFRDTVIAWTQAERLQPLQHVHQGLEQDAWALVTLEWFCAIAA